MKIGIMQPYVMPYIGYFQLIYNCDVFIFYDNVNYIKNGWIDRNRILSNNQATYFKIPISKASSFKKICDTLIHPVEYAPWKQRFFTTLHTCYKRAPYYTSCIKLIEDIFDKEYNSISQLAIASVERTAKYLGLNTIFKIASQNYHNDQLTRSERLINICKQENACTYINMQGGSDLYQPENFTEHGINLKFLSSNIKPYKQYKNSFIGGLSIIDVLMFNDHYSITKNLIHHD
jgi:hypothetical protein